MRAVAVRSKSEIGRPLSVLVPLIQDQVLLGHKAGLEHYRRAGELLNEVRESGQVAEFKWTRWLKENFKLSRATAYDYMLAAERMADPSFVETTRQTLQDVVRPNARPRRKKLRAAFKLHKSVDLFAAEKKARADEVTLHRKLALELIDIGFKALAIRLHPDKHGGEHTAMSRLNRVRRDLIAVAKTRSFQS